MATATATEKQEVRVPAAKRLFDVLGLYIEQGRGAEEAIGKLWIKWGACGKCSIKIAPYADALWNGEAFVHPGCIRPENVVPWDEVCLPDHSGSVEERLDEKKRAKAALAVT